MSMCLSLVVPFLNEKEALPIFYERACALAADQPWTLQIIFVNDGSTDGSDVLARDLVLADPRCLLVNFSRNFGKEPALFAGLSYAEGDVVVPIDVDLQDPIDLIPKMVAEWRNGAEVVLARRTNRMSDSTAKRWSAELFYVLHNLISDIKIEKNVGDYRLMDRKVVDAILELPERKLFMKGLLSWVGFRTVVLDYTREPRIAGSSKFNGWKLWNFALEGITSFSTLPLRLWTYLGLGIAGISLLYAFYMVVDKLVNGNPVPGYPSLMTAILFLGGVQLIGLGVLGEYVGRIYEETKQRPKFVVSGTVRAETDSADDAS